MAITSITTNFAGEIGVIPRLIRIETTDNYSTVTAANYLGDAQKLGYTFYDTDMALVKFATNSVEFFKVSVSGSTITLVPMEGSVVTPTTLNHLAVFADANGTLKMADGVTAIGGDLQAGESGTQGSFIAMPTTAAKGSFKVEATDNTGDTQTTLTNAEMGQTTTVFIPDPAAATGYLQISTVPSSPSSNLIAFDVTVGQAALASGGAVTLHASAGSEQYKIRELFLNSGGTDFSGGGGDRLGQVTDGTTVFSVIPAATMQSLVNARWGSTEVPFPAAAPINTSSAAGAAIRFSYSGGATDYTAGSLVMSGILERVA